MNFQTAPTQEARPSGFVPDNEETRRQRELILVQNEDQLAEDAQRARDEEEKRNNVTDN